MKNTINWGILSTAKIAREKVIPAIHKSINSKVLAIASRDISQAISVASLLNIERAYGSYEELLEDKDIDAIYIPLPNQMHVEWAIKCLEAGKHVLCEKPIGISSAEGQKLLDASKQYPHLKVKEAFMYRFHPQWIKTKELIQNGAIGELKTVHSFFSYYNVDPTNIRNKKEAAGGAMMDIGCYCVSLSRFLFDAEPISVMGNVDFDPIMHIDILSSGILNFQTGSATFTCSTQLMPYQRVQIMGTTGRIEIELPFNTLADKATVINVVNQSGSEALTFEAVDQYTLQATIFSDCILNDKSVPYSLEDAINNMKVIEAVFAASNKRTI